MVVVLLSILGSLLLVLIGLLLLPITYQAQFSSDEKTTLATRISWFGLVVGSYKLGQGVELRVCGYRVSLSRGSPKKPKERKEGDIQKEKSKRRKRPNLDLRALWSIARKVIEHVSPQRIEAGLRFGFEDPYYTGVIGAFLYTRFGGSSVRLTPVYDEEVLEGWFLVEGRVIPVVVLYVALRGYAPVVFRNIQAKFRPNERKVDKYV
ncbi:MAG: DUF2953 domain-containing protein [Bacillota bacterium]|nr:DUF2953 domain-containing protein [Bacillota bacterium]